MKVIKSQKTVYFDVDDTLLIPNYQNIAHKPEDLVVINDPRSDLKKQFLKHARHIELMEQFKVRGHTVVVWSQGGWEWAQNAVYAMGIQNLVDVVLAKPDWYVDDLPSDVFMKGNIYLHPSDPTKDTRRQVVEE
jgi:FMN phosphatase YigB (HAD superfamily)